MPYLLLGDPGQTLQIRRKLISLKEHRVIFVYWASLVQIVILAALLGLYPIATIGFGRTVGSSAF